MPGEHTDFLAADRIVQANLVVQRSDREQLAVRGVGERRRAPAFLGLPGRVLRLGERFLVRDDDGTAWHLKPERCFLVQLVKELFLLVAQELADLPFQVFLQRLDLLLLLVGQLELFLDFGRQELAGDRSALPHDRLVWARLNLNLHSGRLLRATPHGDGQQHDSPACEHPSAHGKPPEKQRCGTPAGKSTREPLPGISGGWSVGKVKTIQRGGSNKAWNRWPGL